MVNATSKTKSNKRGEVKRYIENNKLSIDKVWEKYHEDRENGNGDYYRNLLTEHYRDLVRYCAERLHEKLPDKSELDDLISAGIFGLMEAIERYDTSVGAKFETFCVPRIKGSVLDELRKIDWVPRLVRARTHQLGKATDTLKAKLNRKPNREELLEELSKDKYKNNYDSRLKGRKKAEFIMNDTKNLIKMISLPPMRDEDEEDLLAMSDIKDKRSPDPVLEAQKKDLKENLTKGLTRAERLVIILYYYEEMKIKEIGKVLNLSESRVSQMHSALLSRLKAKLSRRKKAYLEDSLSSL